MADRRYRKNRSNRLHLLDRSWPLLLTACIVVAGLLVTIVTLAVPATHDQPTDKNTDQTQSHSALKIIGPSLLASANYTIAVIGDSTGNQYGEWVYLLGRRLADIGRSVTIHDWSDETKNYSTQQTFGPADGNQVTIWNASVSGQPTQYSLDNWQAIVPEPADFYFINHGHNELAADQAVGGVRRIIKETGASKTAVILQNPRTDFAAARQQSIIDALREYYQYSAVTLIDVYDAFNSSPNLPELLDMAGFQPSEAGQNLWANTVAESIGMPSLIN